MCRYAVKGSGWDFGQWAWTRPSDIHPTAVSPILSWKQFHTRFKSMHLDDFQIIMGTRALWYLN